MPRSAAHDLKPATAALFDWRTGPALWALAIAAACYVLLLPLHAWGEALPPRMFAALGRYTQVLTVIGVAAFAVQAVTMFSLTCSSACRWQR